MKEKFSSRLAFLLVSAGCAIGIGNVWRFPYVAGECGGGAFVIIYLFFLAVLGLPILAMEYAAGRASRVSIAKLHDKLTPGAKSWRIHGWLGFAGNVLLMMFYTVVSGWMCIYFCKSLTGELSSIDVDSAKTVFDRVLADWRTQSMATFCVIGFSAAVCSLDMNKGLEKVSKWMMLFLLALIAVLAVNSCMLEGALEGVKFLLLPDFERMSEIGFCGVVVKAMNQAFFTLSLGVGAMAIFGSYISRERALLGESVNVALLDTFVAVLSGLVIIPACFAFGIKPDQGPGLIFVTLPNVFSGMAFGRLWGTLFFLFMSFAAFTTVLGVFEVIIACMRDYFSISRRRAAIVLALSVSLLSLPCIFGFNLLSSFRPCGEGTNVLWLEDFIFSAMILPLGAMLFVLYATRRFGWGWERFIREVNAGSGLKFPPGLKFYCKYALLAIVGLVFVCSLYSYFS